jgi:hypothetical protein
LGLWLGVVRGIDYKTDYMNRINLGFSGITQTGLGLSSAIVFRKNSS